MEHGGAEWGVNINGFYENNLEIILLLLLSLLSL